MNRPNPTQPNPTQPSQTVTFFTIHISKTRKQIRKYYKIWGDAYIYKLIKISTHQNFEMIYRIWRSGIIFKQTKFSIFFQFPDFFVPDISKTIKVINLKTIFTLLLFDDSKVKMARKPGKKQQENPVRCTG